MLTTVTTTDPRTELVAAAVAHLAQEQERVARLLDRARAHDAWSVSLPVEQRLELVRVGHFPAYSTELDWTPRDVTGHLRDSARIFTERLRRLRDEHDPVLADFVTDAPDRLSDYRSTPPDLLVAQLRVAQTELLGEIADVLGGDLERAGTHEVDGRVTVADLLAFLPGHQQDHAEQLTALVGRLPG